MKTKFSSYSDDLYDLASDTLDDPSYPVSIYARVLDEIMYRLAHADGDQAPISISNINREVLPAVSGPTARRIFDELLDSALIARGTRAYMKGDGDGRYLYESGEAWPDELETDNRHYVPLYADYLCREYRSPVAGHLLYRLIYRHSKSVYHGRDDHLEWSSKASATRDLVESARLGTKKNSQDRYGTIYRLLDKFQDRGWILEDPHSTGYAYEIRLDLDAIAKDLRDDVDNRAIDDTSLCDAHYVVPQKVDLQNACKPQSEYTRRFYSPICEADKLTDLFQHIEDEIADRWTEKMLGPYSLWHTPHNRSERSVADWESFVTYNGGLKKTKNYFTEIFGWLQDTYGKSAGIKWQRFTGRRDLNNLPTAREALVKIDKEIKGSYEKKPQDKGEWTEPDYSPEKYGVDRI